MQYPNGDIYWKGKKLNPSCNIYWKGGQTDFIIESLTISADNGWRVSYGELERVPYDTMMDQGLSVIQANLNEFRVRDETGKSELQNLSPSQRRTFEKNHKMVGIIRFNDTNKIVIQPMNKVRGGGREGSLDVAIEIMLPADNRHFAEMLLEAYNRCL